MANIICGIQSHSRKHTCCWCNLDSDNLLECGTSRSFGSMKEKLLHVQLMPYDGIHFAGNEFHKLLKNLDIPQRKAEKVCAYKPFSFIKTLRCFKEVVSSCFVSKIHFESLNIIIVLIL